MLSHAEQHQMHTDSQETDHKLTKVGCSLKTTSDMPVVLDWRGYHRVSPVNNLPWRCSRRHRTSHPVPPTLTRRLRHINHTSRGARKTARPRQLSKYHLPCRWSGGFKLLTVVTFQRSWYHVLLVRLSGSVSSNLAVLLLSTHNTVTSLAHDNMNTEPCSHFYHAVDFFKESKDYVQYMATCWIHGDDRDYNTLMGANYILHYVSFPNRQTEYVKSV